MFESTQSLMYFCTKVPIKTVADEVVLSIKLQILEAARNGVFMVT